MRTIKSNTTWVATEVSRMFKRSMQDGIPINSWTFELELSNIFSKNWVIFIWILNDTPTVTIMLSPRFNLLWFCLILQVTNRRITTLKAIVTFYLWLVFNKKKDSKNYLNQCKSHCFSCYIFTKLLSSWWII